MQLLPFMSYDCTSEPGRFPLVALFSQSWNYFMVWKKIRRLWNKEERGEYKTKQPSLYAMIIYLFIYLLNSQYHVQIQQIADRDPYSKGRPCGLDWTRRELSIMSNFGLNESKVLNSAATSLLLQRDYNKLWETKLRQAHLSACTFELTLVYRRSLGRKLSQ